MGVRSSGLIVLDEGVPQGPVTELNAVGSGIALTRSGSRATATVSGGGSGPAAAPGGGGSSNDQTALQAAIDAIVAQTTAGNEVFGSGNVRGGELWFPEGLFRADALTIGSYTGHASVKLRGSGQNASVLKKFTAADTAALLTLTTGGNVSPAYLYGRHKVEDLGFQGAASNDSANQASTTPSASWKGTGISVPALLGLKLSSVQFDMLQYGIYSAGGLMNEVDESWFHRCVTGVYLTSGGGMEANWWKFFAPRFAVCQTGLYLAGPGSSLSLYAPNVEFCTTGIRLGTGASALAPHNIDGGHFEFNTTNVQIDTGAPHTNIRGVEFYGGDITVASGCTATISYCAFQNGARIVAASGTGDIHLYKVPGATVDPTVVDPSGRVKVKA